MTTATWSLSPPPLLSLPTVLSGSPTATVREDIPRPETTTSSQIDSLAWALRGIQEAYTIPCPVDALRFLRQHPSLAPLVWEAAYVLRHVFGVGTRLSLTLVRDPETGDEELFALVHVQGPVEEALQKLETFDRAWFLDRQDETGGRFNVDVVFR